MSTAGIASLALFAPVVASNAVFSARRATRGVDNIEENPLFAIANFDIAAGQILKGGRAAKALAIAADPASNIATNGAAETIKATATSSNKFLKGVGKVVNFTADHINPIIIGAGALKVLGSDDKLDAAAREATALTCMFTAEAATKSFVGMPVLEKVNGKTVANHVDGAYKNLLNRKQIEALSEFFLVKKAVSECTLPQKFLKATPGIAKGLLFVGASIAGYEIGNKIATAVLGEKKQSA